MVASFTDTLLDISGGVVAPRTREQNRARFQRYFDRVSFQQWDDIAPSRIRISPDGRMAYVVVQKSVRLTSQDAAGAPQAEHTLFAWVEIYEKRGGKWHARRPATKAPTRRAPNPGLGAFRIYCEIRILQRRVKEPAAAATPGSPAPASRSRRRAAPSPTTG
jgi:hypothetical protein